MKRTIGAFSTTIFLAGLFLAGCGKSEGVQPNENAATGASPSTSNAVSISKDPVTVKMFLDSALSSEYEAQIKESLAKTYPQITLEIVSPGTGSTLTDLIAAGDTPDIIYTYNGKVASFQQQDLLYDMTQLVKQHNLDLSRFDPAYIEDIKIASTNNELFAIPLSLSYHALYYNKDIFDKFGVDYPTDGMTWDQVLNLAKKMTRNDGTTKVRGFDTGNMVWVSQPLGIAAIDYKTDKATVNTDQWKKVFEMMKSFYTIPGNEPNPKVTPKDSFIKDQNLAMYADLNIVSDLTAGAQKGLNWDVVQYPSYPEKPNTYGNASVTAMMVTKTSKHKDQAMAVVTTTASEEVQLAMSKLGYVSPLTSSAVRQAFGTSLDVFKGKNVQGIFKSHPVKYPIASQYRSAAEAIVRNQFNEFVNNKGDVNSILAATDELINKSVEAARAK